MRLTCAALALAAVAAAMPARGHETWLATRSARLAAPGTLVLGVSSGMDFPRPDSPVDPALLKNAGVRLGTEHRPLEAVTVIGGSAILRGELPRPGIATAWIDLPPIALTLDPALIDVYLDEIRADAALRAVADRQRAATPPIPWRERYVKFSKTIVRVGAAADDRSWGEPIGGPIEIVPDDDPTALAKGAGFAVRVLKAGQPLAGLPIALMESGERAWQRTDAAGRARFDVRTNGPWLVHCTELHAPAALDGEWRSWFATLAIGATGER